VDNLRNIYHKPLYKLPASSPADFIKARLIYLRLYPQKVNVQSEADIGKTLA